MLELDMRFTGLSLTERDGIFVLRDFDSFKDVYDTIIGKPLLLMHPKDENGDNVLLNINSDYKIVGHISKVYPYNNGDEIRVQCTINDPLFVEYYNSLSDNDKANLLSTSPGVESIYEDQIDYNGKNIVYEKVTSIDHLSIILTELFEKGYWDKYINSIPIMDVNEEERYIINDKLLNSEANDMAELERTSTGVEVEPKLDEEVDKRQLIREEMAIADKPVDEFKGGAEEKAETIAKLAEEEAYNPSESGKNDSEEIKEESVEEKVEFEDSEIEKKFEDSIEDQVEELLEHEKQEGDVFEELAEDHKELDSDEIVEEFETPEDIEREVVVELVHNLVDSVEGFKKPYFKNRVKADTYIRKALSLNKEFIDNKYHTSLDSISVELGKELLSEIKNKQPEVKMTKTYKQIDSNTFIKSFI